MIEEWDGQEIVVIVIEVVGQTGGKSWGGFHPCRALTLIAEQSTKAAKIEPSFRTARFLCL